MFFLDFIGKSFESFDAVGVQAFRASTSGSANAAIDTYSSVDWQNASDFNSSTGVYTVPETGAYFIAAQGFPEGGLNSGSGTWTLDVRLNTSTSIAQGKSFHFTANHGTTAFVSLVRDLTASDTINLYQTVDTANNVSLLILKIDEFSGAYFGATRVTTAGSAGGTIGSLTENSDKNGDFNPTTGIFTAPSDGVYLLGGGGGNSSATAVLTEARLLVNSSQPSNYSPRCETSSAGQANSGGNILGVELSSADTAEWQQIGDELGNVSLAGFSLPDSRGGLFSAYSTSTYTTGGADLTGFTDRITPEGSGWDATNGKFTAPADGLYMFSHLGDVVRNTGEGRIYLRKNGSNVIWSSSYSNNYVVRNPGQCTVVLDMESGDEITWQIEAGSTVTSMNVFGWRMT